ncbi:MAG: Gfo/Idh/MocA family oxidoreductase [Flavobacteriaceae bacterium]
MAKSKPNSQSIKRRDFVKSSIAASSIFIVPRHVLGGLGYTAPSDQLGLAAIGAGGKGAGDIRNASVNGRERVVALCDVDSSGGNGISRSIKKFSDAQFYDNFKKMLDKEKDIEAVTISTPDHTHAAAAVYAMERGIHVYVQKPLTHNIYEARLLTEMAREKQIVSQMGNQGASNPEQLQIQKWILDGRIGKISKIEIWTDRPVWPQGGKMPAADASAKPEGFNWDQWLGPAQETPFIPNMHPFNWRGWWNFGTGALGDMGCHLIDIPFKALGLKYPTDVECSVGSVYEKMWTANYYPEGCPPSSSVSLHFDPTEINDIPMQMTWSDGGIKPFHPDLLPADVPIAPNGVLMIGEKGVISCDAYGEDAKLYVKNEAVVESEKTIVNEPEFGHQRQWVDACKAGFNSPEHKALTSSFDYSGPLTETVLMGNIAIRSYLLRSGSGREMEFIGRKKLLWDGEAMKIKNLEEANQFVGRAYRKGWELT